TVSRVIQVLLQPTFFRPFSYAIFTQDLMNWGSSGKFSTDSWNSSNIALYPTGVTLDNNNPNAPHANGDIGVNSSATPAIMTYGGTVNGNVSTPNGQAGIDSKAIVSGNPDGMFITSPKLPMPVPIPPNTTNWPFYLNAPATVPVNGTQATPTKIHVTNGGTLSFSGTG